MAGLTSTMKRIVFVFIILSVSLCVEGQAGEQRFTYATTVGTGIAMSRPASTPLTWQLLGYYNITHRVSAGG